MSSGTINSKIQFCTFLLAGRVCGIDILDIKEINMERNFTPIPHAPAEIKGYVNIRGQIYLVADLRMLMGFDQSEIEPKSRLIIFKDNALESFAVVVDQIGDVVSVNSNEIMDRRAGEMLTQELEEKRKDAFQIGAGVCKLDKHLMVVVNSRNLLKKIARYFNKQ